MDKCYEYLGCKQTECIMQKQQSKKKCWEAERTLAIHLNMEAILSAHNKSKCDYCIYYKMVHECIGSQNMS